MERSEFNNIKKILEEIDWFAKFISGKVLKLKMDLYGLLEIAR